MHQNENFGNSHHVLETTKMTLALPIPNYVDKCIPLNENKIIVYFDGGDWVLYNLIDQKQISAGKIATGCKVFKQIWADTLFYLDAEDLKVKLIDFKTNSINPNYTFDASLEVKGNSDAQKKETVAEKFQILLSEGDANNYMVTLDQKRQYSNENHIEILIRDIPKKYVSEQKFEADKFTRVQYANATGQCEIYNWNINKTTLAVFGQDFENGQMEFCLIKPALKEKSVFVIHIKEPKSYTLMNITNWHSEHEIAIWMNNNEGSEVPCIDTIDLRAYYDADKQSWQANEPEYEAKRRIAALQADPPQTLIDVVQFQRNQPYALQHRLVGVEPHLTLANWEDQNKGSLVSEEPLGDWNYETPTDKSYILHFDEFKTEGQVFDIKVTSSFDIRYFILKMLEETKVIEQFEDHNVGEIFDFYL